MLPRSYLLTVVSVLTPGSLPWEFPWQRAEDRYRSIVKNAESVLRVSCSPGKIVLRNLSFSKQGLQQFNFVFL